jgi:hypothetical protein
MPVSEQGQRVDGKRGRTSTGTPLATVDYVQFNLIGVHEIRRKATTVMLN